MEFGTFWPPEVTHYFGDKHTHDSDHAECEMSGIADVFFRSFSPALKYIWWVWWTCLTLNMLVVVQSKHDELRRAEKKDKTQSTPSVKVPVSTE